MTNKINASSTSGLSQTGSNSSVIEIQSEGVTGIRMNADSSIDVLTELTVNGVSINGEAPATITVASMVALKALITRPASVIIQGYYNPGDGGGGTFAWYPGDSSTSDDAMVVTPTSGPSGRYKRLYDGDLNLLWFGAVGDNITPNTVAINKAVAAAKLFVASRGNQPINIYVPSGLYKIDGPIDVITSPLTFYADNERGTQFTPSGNYDVFTFAGTGIRCANAGFRSIGMNATNMTGGYCIALDWAQNFTLDNVLIANPYNGMSVRQAGQICIRNTLFDRVRGDVGFYAYGDNSLRPNGEYDHCDVICFSNTIIHGLLPPVGGSSSTVMMKLDGRIHTVQCDGLRLINGGTGFQALNTPGLASNLVPRFIVGVSLEIENMHNECVDAQALRDFVPAYFFAAGSHTKDGVKLSSNVYNFAPSRTYIGTNYFNGIDTNGAKSVILTGAVIHNNSLVGVAQKFGVFVSGNGIFNFSGGLYGKDTTIPDYTEPQRAGIGIDGGFGGTIIVDGVDLRGNNSTAIEGIGSPSIYSSVKSCPGYNPVGPTTVSVGASPFDYIAGLTEEHVNLYGGSGVTVTIGGVTIANASPCSFTLRPRQTVTITHSGAPTMVVNKG